MFVSLACDVDGTVGSAWNLNRVLVDRGSVTTVAATVPTYFEPGINDVVKIETEALPILMAGGGTLLQNIATVRGDYDTLTQGYSDEDRVYTWSNLLSLNVTGDGLVRLGP